MSEVPILTVRPGGVVIYRYDSYSNDPAYEGQPCGVAYDGPTGKRIILSFPVYYLTPATAEALIAKAKEYFGEGSVVIKPGDINNSGTVDLSDLSALIAYLTGQMPALPNPNGGDVNGSCFINLVDLSSMINYLIFGQPTPVPGCVVPQ